MTLRKNAALPDWARDGAVYQIYPRSFQDSNGDGIGDLPGLLSRLEDVQALGITTVWLSPVHPSPQADFGYDVADYCDVDPVYGNLADLDALIEALHERGMRLVLDGVFNHTSVQHPWFQESRKGPNNPKRDWYLWRDRPNNWASTFGGPAWTQDGDQYYLHSFLPEQPDLNWRNPEVVDAVLDVLRFWFARGVDGFRLDVFNSYRKHPDLLDNPRRCHPGGLFYRYIGQHHLNDRDQPDLPEVLGRMREVADAHGAVLIGETLDENFRYERAKDFIGEGLLHMDFHFGLLHSRWSAQKLVHAIRSWIDEQPPTAWPTWVLSNHDFPRHPSRWGGGDARAKALATLVLTLPGTPFLYYGEELGMPQASLSRADIVDPPGKRFWPFFKGRDGARTPMQWSDEPHAGFTTGAPWLPVSSDYPERNVDVQRADPQSIWNAYRRLLALRQDPRLQQPLHHIEARGGVVRWQLGDDVVGLMNTGSSAVPCDELGEVLFSTHQGGDPGRLEPHEARVSILLPSPQRSA